jgi:hypothetical protein
MKILFTFLLFPFFTTVQGQSLYEKIVAVQRKGNINIDHKMLDGIWTSADTSTCGLVFESSNKGVKLIYKDNITFSFTKFKNLKEATIFGTHFNWPP